MGSQTLEILRQGVWASLCGGWFYDPSMGVLANIFHLYVWILLVCTPFSMHLVSTYLLSDSFKCEMNIRPQYFPRPAKWIWIPYLVALLLFFVVIKYFNLRLHSMFDTQECVEVEDADTENDGDGDVRNKHDLRGNKNGLNRRQNETAGTEEDIELQEMGGQGSENYELEGAAFIDEASRRPSRDDDVVSSGPLDVLEEGGKESKTSEAEQELSAASRNVSNSTSERMATFGTLQNFI